MSAVAWMQSYFNRDGDKCPDKEAVYLPSCLSGKAIYNLMAEDLGSEHCVSHNSINFSEAICTIFMIPIQFRYRYYHTRFVSKWDTSITTRTTSSYSVLEQLSLELTGRDSGIESNDYDIEVVNRSYDYWN